MLTFCVTGFCERLTETGPVGKLLKVAAVWGLVIFLCRGWTVLSLRYQLEYGEGYILGLAYFLKQGKSVYHPGASPPWIYTHYLPLYLWLLKLCMGPTPSFLPARLISFLATLVTLGASVAWMWRRRGGACACAALGFMLLHPLILGWAPLARVDNLGLTLSILAVLLARPRFSVWLCALALFCKQSFVAAPLALAWWFGRRTGPRFLAALAAIVGLAMLPLEHPSGGGLISSWVDAWFLIWTYSLSVLPLVMLAFLAPRKLEETRLLAAFTLAALIPAAACIKQGSYYNYFLELHWGLSMLGALALCRASKPVCLLALLQILLGSLSQFPILHSPVELFHYETIPSLSGRSPFWVTKLQAQNDQLGPLLEKYPGPVLAEQLGNPLLFGREPLVCEPYALLKDLAPSGHWDPRPLLQMIEQRKIALVVLQRLGDENPRIPPYVMGPILENYQVIGQLGERGDFILIPKAQANP